MESAHASPALELQGRRGEKFRLSGVRVSEGVCLGTGPVNIISINR